MNVLQLELREAYARIDELQRINTAVIESLQAKLYPDVACHGRCGDNVGYQCELCFNWVCVRCAHEPIEFVEYLEFDAHACETCKKKVCHGCARACCDCLNSGDTSAFQCKNCSPMRLGVCPHYWITCGKHTKETYDCCSECVRFTSEKSCKEKYEAAAKKKRRRHGSDDDDDDSSNTTN